MAHAEADLIPLSALQHYLFCPRQCALIHVEQAWEENLFTAEGRVLHDRVDTPGTVRRAGVRTVHAMPLRSLALGVAGIADCVEFHGDTPYPVEYKRGRPKTHRADEVQLCAQALCLEEMLETTVERGALFYGKTRRRSEIAFDDGLRALTRRIAGETRALVAAGRTPPPVYKAGRCKSCSLIGPCRPQRLSRGSSAARWLSNRVREAG